MSNALPSLLGQLGVSAARVPEFARRIADLSSPQREALTRAIDFEVRATPLKRRHAERDPYQFDYALNALFTELLGTRYPARTGSGDEPSVFERDAALEADELETLQRTGYVVSALPLPPAPLAEVRAALARYVFKSHDGSGSQATGAQLLARLAGPKAAAPELPSSTYWLDDMDAAVRDPVFGRMAFDPHILSMVGSYFGCSPIHVQTNAWFSFPGNAARAQLSASAQLYHQDKEFTKFLKVFIYLDDVGSENGPHCYVASSHKDELFRFGIPFSTRVDDAEIERLYGRDRMHEITGPAGTTVFGDTSCAHKGEPVRAGHRVILQLEYAASLYLSPIAPFSDLAPEAVRTTGEALLTPRLLANYDTRRRARWLALIDAAANRSAALKFVDRAGSWLQRKWHAGHLKPRA
jgi:hypothetical protein